MSVPETDESQPLLSARAAGQPKRTPLPYLQLWIVIFFQLAEPLTSQVIYPFAPQLIRDIGVTNGDETKVGYYVGTIESLFFLTQALTVLNWSRLSDRIGRKPVILCGLFGISLSMYSFGLSRTFWGLVVSRCVNGALNGNIGVIKSMVAEMADSTNIAQAYAYMPIAWSTGGVLGPMIGGSLSHPVQRFPAMFGESSFLETFPYFLPCAVSATYAIVAWIVALLFLKETRTGASVVRIPPVFGRKRGDAQAAASHAEAETTSRAPDSGSAVPMRTLITSRRVLLAGSAYAFQALVDMSLRAIQPVFLSTPIELGGLGLPTPRIGNWFSVIGVLGGIFQVFFFAPLLSYMGGKRTYLVGILCGMLTFVTLPLLNYIARAQGLSLILWVVGFVQIALCIGLGLAGGAVFIYISAAAPNRASLGATNGLCQLSVSLMRTIGPAAANSLFALSLEKGYLGGRMVYYVLMGVACVALWVGAQLPAEPWVRVDY